MSVIRKLPYIEALLASMTAANLKDLRTVLNTGGSNVNLDFEHLNAATYKNKVTPVYFKFEDNGLKTGILIWTNSMCALICYHKYQDLLIFELSPTYHTSKKINEYCDINELRRVLDDTVESTGAIDSGSAEEGALPFADGQGGVGWDKPLDYLTASDFDDATTAVKMVALDDTGKIVKADLPEGTFVVDSALSDSSENPVQNKVITEAITNIQEDITEINGDLETKANVDGNYPTMTVGAADNLTPYDESAGDDQDEPFSFQATGTGNGSQADFATGALALMKEKRGNSVVVNQRLNYTPISTGEGSDSIYKWADSVVIGHKYLVYTQVDVAEYIQMWESENKINDWSISANNVNLGQFSSTSSPFRIITITTYTNFMLRSNMNGTVANKTWQPFVIDLTQWFGSNDNIPADLLAHPENFFRYYQGSLAYNAGQIVNANSRYIKCIGRQQWDEEWEEGYISNDTGANASASGFIRSKNYIPVTPNARYAYYCGANIKGVFYFYDKDKNFITGLWTNNRQEANSGGYFDVPSNALFIRFYTGTGYGGTYNYDITISLYYEGESGYDQYYPYEVLTNNDTGTEELKSAGSVKDYKTPDGTITRKVGSVDLGTLSWTEYQTNRWSATLPENTLSYGGSDTPIGLTNKNYVLKSRNNVAGVEGEMWFTSTTVYVYSTSSPTGTLYYPLATPTTEQGTPFSENLVIDDFGSMEFSGTSGVPQGNLIFYPVDYKAFVDTLYDYTEGTPSNIQLKSDLSTAITTFLTGLTGYDATKKQTLKNNEGVLSWEDDE